MEGVGTTTIPAVIVKGGYRLFLNNNEMQSSGYSTDSAMHHSSTSSLQPSAFSPPCINPNSIQENTIQTRSFVFSYIQRGFQHRPLFLKNSSYTCASCQPLSLCLSIFLMLIIAKLVFPRAISILRQTPATKEFRCYWKRREKRYRRKLQMIYTTIKLHKSRNCVNFLNLPEPPFL